MEQLDVANRCPSCIALSVMGSACKQTVNMIVFVHCDKGGKPSHASPFPIAQLRGGGSIFLPRGVDESPY